MTLPFGLSLLEAVVMTHLGIGLAVYLPSALVAVVRSRRLARVAVTRADLAISALKPLCGLDPSLEENLLSFASLDVPGGFEVLLLVDGAEDRALPLARQMEHRFPGRFRVLVGTTPGLANPKVASVVFGLSQARNELIWMTDSNVETSDAHLRAQVEAWKWAQREGRRPTLVHAPHGAVHGTGLGAAFERLHLATYNNIYAQTTQVAGIDAVVGKSLLFHRDDLAAVGGLERLGSASGEDYLLGRAFRRGGTVRLSARANRQVLGEGVGMVDFWRRQARWAAVRKYTSPATFYLLEHFTYFGLLWVWLALGLVSWPLVVAVFALKMAVDASVQVAFSGRAALGDVALLPLKDLVVLAAWVSGFFLSEVTWRGRTMAVNRDGSYRLPSPTAERAALEGASPVRASVVPVPGLSRASAALLNRGQASAPPP